MSGRRQPQPMAQEKLTGKVLFFSDIDDTLVNTDKTLCEENRIAIETFLSKGNLFVISTGRALTGACNLLKKLGLYGKENLLVSSSNGAIVYDTFREKELLRRPIPLDLVVEAFDLARDFGIFIQTYTDTSVIAETDCESLQKYVSIQNLPVEICENGFTVEGSYRTSDESATLVVKAGGYTSNNLIRSSDGNAHSFAEKIVVNDVTGLWTADKAVLEFKGASATSSKTIDLQVNKACTEVNTKAPTIAIATYDSLRCIANVSIGEMQNDAGIFVAMSDGSQVLEETVTKNAQKRVKLQKGRHEYTIRIEDQAGNQAEISKVMGCYPNKHFPIEVFGPAKEVLKVPPPPKDVPDRIVQTLQFRIRIPENNPEYLYKVTVRQNGKVILQESLAQIRSLDYQIPVMLLRGVRNHIDIEVVHKSGYVSKGKKDYEVR